MGQRGVDSSIHMIYVTHGTKACQKLFHAESNAVQLFTQILRFKIGRENHPCTRGHMVVGDGMSTKYSPPSFFCL